MRTLTYPATKKVNTVAAIAAAVTTLSLSIDPATPVTNLDSLAAATKGFGVLWVFAVAGLFFLYRYTLGLYEKRLFVVCGIFGGLFALCQLLGASLERTDPSIRYILGGAPFTVWSCLVFLFQLCGYTLLFGSALSVLFHAVQNRQPTPLKQRRIFTLLFESGAKSFFLCWAILFACWLPYFIIWFPGIITSDTLDQIYQGLGLSGYNAHHPVIHSFVLGRFVALGQFLGSNSLGLALLSLLQQLAFSALYAWVVRFLGQSGYSIRLRLIALIYFAIHPVIAIYSIHHWKDVWLANLLLVVLVLVIDICNRRRLFFKSPFRIAALFFAALFATLAKNNGIYIVAVTAVLLVAFVKGCRVQSAAVLCSVLILSKIITGPLFSYWDISPALAREALSLPGQQVARTVTLAGDTISGEDYAMLNRVIPFESGEVFYNPAVSDPVKNYINIEPIQDDPGGYAGLWLRLMAQRPRIFLEATLAQNFGYWYPIFHHVADIVPYGMYVEQAYLQGTINARFDTGVSQDMETYSVPLSIGEFIYKIIPNIPVVHLFYTVGFYFWFALISVAYLLYRKRFIAFIPLSLLFTLWLTCIASPVYAEFRYGYFAVIAVPIVLALAFGNPAVPAAEGTPKSVTHG